MRRMNQGMNQHKMATRYKEVRKKHSDDREISIVSSSKRPRRRVSDLRPTSQRSSVTGRSFCSFSYSYPLQPWLPYHETLRTRYGCRVIGGANLDPNMVFHTFYPEKVIREEGSVQMVQLGRRKKPYIYRNTPLFSR